MLHFCGVLMEAFPDLAKGDDAARLLRIYIDQLKTHMSGGRHSKVVVIVGCFEGLAAFLSASPQMCDPELAENARGGQGNLIYRYLRMAFASESVRRQTRFEAPRRALEVFAKHAHLFRPLLPRDYEDLYNNLFELCDFQNKDIKSAAFRALEAFLQQAAILIMQTEANRTSRDIFASLMGRFLATMRNPSPGARELSVAIRGCGYLAGPCLKLQVCVHHPGREGLKTTNVVINLSPRLSYTKRFPVACLFSPTNH